MQLQARVLSLAVLAGLASPAFAGKADNPAALRAKELLASHGPAVQRASADAFTVRDVVVDRDGTEHVRFDRTYNGLPVIGGDVVVHSRNGALKSSSLTLKTTGRPALSPKLSAEQAVLAAGADFGGTLSDIGS
jgi:Zn-dependent metalloprotease